MCRIFAMKSGNIYKSDANHNGTHIFNPLIRKDNVMKKLIFALTLGTFCFLGTSVATFAQERGVGEAHVKSLTQSFNEEDYFTTVDADNGFSDVHTKHFFFPRVYRWYYRPWVAVVRPVYYPPVYTYYHYHCVPYACHFSWATVSTTAVIYKSANDSGNINGAVIDSDPAPGSVLARQGLRKGDIITHIDGQPLKSLQDMSRATANSKLTVQKGNETQYAGNLLKSADEKLMKNFEGMREVEASGLMTNKEIGEANLNMYDYFNRNADKVVFGVRAAENNGNGVKIMEVQAGMPGQKSGFQVDDVILEINGVKITGEKDYSEAIDRAGKIARMKVLCGKTGQTVDADVELNK